MRLLSQGLADLIRDLQMEETANLNESVVALDQLSTRAYRKANVVKDTSKGEQQRGAKSAFGLIKRLAVNYVRKAKQLGLPGPAKRLEVDPLFAYNCSTTQLTSGSLNFLHRLARAIFANPGRSAQERKRALDDQEREHHSKLRFIPTIARDPNEALSIEDESFVCHHNPFFNLKQFSMWRSHWPGHGTNPWLPWRDGEAWNACRKATPYRS